MRDAIARDPWQLIERLSDACLRTTPLRIWKEYLTPVGRIDLLIAWPDNVLIVECKRDIADENAIAQVLRYAGTIELVATRHIVVAAAGFTNQAQFAAKAGGVALFAYDPALDLHRADPIATPEGWSDELRRAVCPSAEAHD